MTKTMQAIRRRCADERGVALIIAAGSMVALTSAVALAIDVGMMTATRSEAQRVADAAAMAGAGALIQTPDNSAYARAQARETAGRNEIRGSRAQVLDQDVDVDLSTREVTVRVLRTAERGNPVGTFFARVFGVNTVDITADATAWASPAGGINCLLPVTLPDRWHEAGGPGNSPDSFDPDKGDYYEPWQVPDSDPAQYNENFTGYTQNDIGTQITIKSNTASGDYNPSWYYPWRPPGQSGGDDYRTNVSSCVDPSIAYSVGMEVDTEPGNMRGPTLQGFGDLIAQDPTAVWNEQLDCITDATDVLSSDGGSCRSSPRIRPVPLFDPTSGPANGASSFSFTNFAGIFVEGIQGNDVVARWIGYSGFEPADPGEVTAGPQFQVVQLIH
ncbi:MAG: pilus assembly protein TadG-related protein [Gemmatimonadales bacterium]